MRLRTYILLAVFTCSQAVHATTMLDPTSAVSTLNLLISQYETRIKQLEAENAVLRNEMMKA
jgi:hypothetical protein